MTQTSAPNPTRIADRLPDSVYLHVVETLRGNLPDPPSKDPEHRARQLEAAIAEVGSFAPANAAEANLAARYVAFSAHADDCLRLARVKASQGELDWAVKCRNQANATARQASGQLNRAAWAEHCAIGTMTDALAGQPTPENNSPSLCGTEPGEDRQAATPCDQTPSHHTVPTVEPPTPELEPEPLSEALSYAVLYPERAALIRGSAMCQMTSPSTRPTTLWCKNFSSPRTLSSPCSTSASPDGRALRSVLDMEP
jgi:hypothetical protein